MASDGQRPASTDVRVTRRRAVPILIPGLVVLAVLGWLTLRTTPAPPPPAPPPTAHAPAATHPTVDTAPHPTDAATPDTTGTGGSAHHDEMVERTRQRREEREVDRRSRAEPQYTLNAPGEHQGLAAFPPPGSKPIKEGIVVPDDVELPPGYVRHYQTTDDGRQLPPILMYHPDFAGTDANGNPITPPGDRVVPPEQAPPGLPHRMLDPTTDAAQDAGQVVGRQRHGDAPYTPLPAAR